MTWDQGPDRAGDQSRAISGIDEEALVVVEASLTAYGETIQLGAGPRLSIADVLALGLYSGSTGHTSARLQRAAEQVDAAIADLRYVRDRLRERAVESTCLPLALVFQEPASGIRH